jgi:hypothetical protein
VRLHRVSRRKGKPKAVRDAAAAAALPTAATARHGRVRRQCSCDYEDDYQLDENPPEPSQSQGRTQLQNAHLDMDSINATTSSQAQGTDGAMDMFDPSHYHDFDMDMADFNTAHGITMDVLHGPPCSPSESSLTSELAPAALPHPRLSPSNGSTVATTTDSRLQITAIPASSPLCPEQMHQHFGNNFMSGDLPYLSPAMTSPSSNPVALPFSSSILSNPPGISEPAPKTAKTKTGRHCNHDAFLLAKLSMIEDLRQAQIRYPASPTAQAPSNPPNSLPATTNSSPRISEHQHQDCSFSLDQLLSLKNSAFPSTTTTEILSCGGCARTPSTLLSFALLIDKVLGLYQTYLDGYGQPRPLSSSLCSAARCTAKKAVLPASLSQQRSPPSPSIFQPVQPQPPALGPTTATRLGSYSLSTAEQGDVLRVLLASRLSAIGSLIKRLRSKVESTKHAAGQDRDQDVDQDVDQDHDQDHYDHGRSRKRSSTFTSTSASIMDMGIGSGMEKACDGATEHLCLRLKMVRDSLDRFSWGEA